MNRPTNHAIPARAGFAVLKAPIFTVPFAISVSQKAAATKEKFMNTTTQARRGESLRQWAAALLVLFAGALFTLASSNAQAAPAAGTVIGNQATAAYNDAGGTPRTATSNLVQTTVSQVKSFT